ncbi:MAG: hypothetical protein AAF242_20055 [Bacteroidota bacterium]
MDQATIDDIIKAIGNNESEDYLLDLGLHVERYKEAFPAFTKLLVSDEIGHLVNKFHQYDDEALAWQKKYRKYSQGLRWSTFGMAVFSATMIMAGTLNTNKALVGLYPDLPDLILRGSTILTIIFSGVGTTLIMLIKRLQLLEKWMKNRAQAEDYRMQYFNQIAEDLPTQDTRLHLICLEYFRRYQLDKQLSYYQERGSKLDQVATRQTIWIAALAGSVIVINGIIGFQGLEYTPWITLTLIIQAYAALISNKQSGEQNERNAQRYKKLDEELGRIRAKFTKLRNAIASGKRELLQQLIETVHEPMRLEDQEWMETMQASSTAIESLEKQLE